MAYRTADFQDANNNGTDDRDENTARRQNPQVGGAKPYTGQNPTSGQGIDEGNAGNLDNQQAKMYQPQVTPKNDTNPDYKQAALKQMQNGNLGFGSMIKDLFGGSNGRNDDGYTFMRDAFQFDVGSKFFNTQLGMAQSEHNLAQNKEGMRYANMLDRQTMQESRNHIFGLNMKTMDKQFNLTDEMANRDYGRNLGTLAATGEQTRKNYAAEGVQNRLGTITEGEQERLNIGKTATENRTTMTHEDNIAAGREKRHNKSARNTAMSF